MDNNPTLRDVGEAFSRWLDAQSTAVKNGLTDLGDIHVSTIFGRVPAHCG